MIASLLFIFFFFLARRCTCNRFFREELITPLARDATSPPLLSTLSFADDIWVRKNYFPEALDFRKVVFSRVHLNQGKRNGKRVRTRARSRACVGALRNGWEMDVPLHWIAAVFKSFAREEQWRRQGEVTKMRPHSRVSVTERSKMSNALFKAPY